MNLSIVICTYNRAHFLKLALESLLPQVLQCSVNDIEVVVVDNNSNDGSFAVIKEFQLKFQSLSLLYFLEKQQGLSFSRNRAILESKGNYIVFLDDDATVNDQWLSSLLEAINNQDANVFGGPIYPNFESTCPAWIDSNYFVRTFRSGDGYLNSISAKSGFSGGNMCFARDIFQLIGVFNTSLGMNGTLLGLGEETDLFNRLHQSTYEAKLYNINLMSISHFESSKKFEKSYLKERIKLSGYQFTNRMLAQSKFVGSISVFLKLVKQFLFSIVYLLQIPFIEKCRFKFLKCIWLISGLLKGFF